LKELQTNLDGLPPGQRRWAILTIALAIFITVIDQTIVNVALPTIGADLKIAPSSSVWIVNAYQMAIMLSLLPLASAGDILGYKRVYLAGLTLFGLASLGCALSPSLLALTLMRVVQGLGAAGVMSVNMALVRFMKSSVFAPKFEQMVVLLLSRGRSNRSSTPRLSVTPFCTNV